MKIKIKKIDEKIAENYTKIKIGGTAEIIHKDDVIKCRNKFTRYLMNSITGYISNSRCATAYMESRPECGYAIGMAQGATARIGTDVSTTSSPDMSDLVSKVDKAPNSITRRLIKEPDYALYIAEFVFTWNAGTLPNIYEGATGENDIDGRVGEFGVYLRLDYLDYGEISQEPCRASKIAGTSLGLPYNTWTYIPLGRPEDPPNVRLASRIASADGAFDPFEFYGSINPLTFKWRFQVAIV